MSKEEERDYENIRRQIEQSSVLTYKPEKCYTGYTLFSTYMGNIFYLINMKGKVVHTWRVRTAKVGEILPNGHLMYGHVWNGMVEIDRDSNELWHYGCSQHHDFAVMPNGHVMILCGIRERGSPPKPVLDEKYNPEIREGGPFATCYLIEVEPKTNEIVWEWWADEHMEELKSIGVKFPAQSHDVFHTNTCEVLPETKLGEQDSRFKAGNVLFNHKNLSVIGVIDKSNGKIVWAWGDGILNKPHAPTLIPDVDPITGKRFPGAGHLLIYDNGPDRGWSRIVELDPLSEEIVWEYKPDGFWGSGGGNANRMPNGNTVICEGGLRGRRGRLFEITLEGEIVWEYLTPYFDGVGGHEIYRCVRYPSTYIENMLERMGTSRIYDFIIDIDKV